MSEALDNITELLNEWSGHGQGTDGRVFEALYPHLRAVAANKIKQEHGRVSIQVTELVHEAFLKLEGQARVSWQNRIHFLAVSSLLMRRILVDQFRKRASLKRGCRPIRVELGDLALEAEQPTADILALHVALEKLAESHPDAARLVELRYFGGMTVTEAAAFLKISKSTAIRRWQFARIWLKKQIDGSRLAPPARERSTYSD